MACRMPFIYKISKFILSEGNEEIAIQVQVLLAEYSTRIIYREVT
jgi:hypothetical protein